MVGGEDEHSSPLSAGTGGDPSLRLSGFIIRLRCSALPEERAVGWGRGAHGPRAPAGGTGAISEFLVVGIFKSWMLWAG